jgi:hypothetical protein
LPSFWDEVVATRHEWRPRLASLASFAAFRSWSGLELHQAVAAYFASWFAAFGLLTWMAAGNRFLFVVTATFCALVYAGTPVAENTWCPWDMPALFWSTAALYAALHGKKGLLALAVILGGLFKETILLYSVLFFFLTPASWRQRFVVTASTATFGYGLRILVERMVGNDGGLSTMSYHVGDVPDAPMRWHSNLGLLLTPNLNHVVLCNLGLWAVVFVLPRPHPVFKGFIIVGALHYLGNLVAGRFIEFRIFFETLTGSLLLLDHYLRPQDELAK